MSQSALIFSAPCRVLQLLVRLGWSAVAVRKKERDNRGTANAIISANQDSHTIIRIKFCGRDNVTELTRLQRTHSSTPQGARQETGVQRELLRALHHHIFQVGWSDPSLPATGASAGHICRYPDDLYACRCSAVGTSPESMKDSMDQEQILYSIRPEEQAMAALSS